MKKSRWIAPLVALMIVSVLAAGCRKKQEDVSGMSQEDKARYSVGLHAGKDGEKQEKVLLEDREKLSYALGLVIGRDIDQQELELDPDLVARGFQDAYSGKGQALTEEEIEKVREEFRKQRRTAQEDEAAKNLEEGKAFLAENAKKEGVVTLPSGLQYRIINPGTGERPTAEDNVKVHYRGYFIDGTEFENTYTQQQPAVFPVTGVIPGWTEALQLMKEGAKWELYIPSDLAYGEKGAGKVIGPNKTLIFEIELLGIH